MKPVILVSLLISATAFAEKLPSFEDYHAPKPYNGPRAAPKLSTPEARRFRTVLRREAQGAPNFAGHYRLVNLGCGASCGYPAIIDLKTGEVTIPGFHTVSTTGPEPLEHRVDSRLLLVHGDFNEKQHRETTHYFEWANDLLEPIYPDLDE